MTKLFTIAAILFIGFPGLGFGIQAIEEAGPDARPSEVVRVPVSIEPVVDVEPVADEDRSVVDEALTRFRDAGLELPDLTIRFSVDDADCHGHDGYFDPSTQPWNISICSGAKFVMTHELAHAWEAAHLADADRDQYAEVRGYQTWNSKQFAWSERAIEDAAFMIQQNLMAGNVDTDSDRWQERITAFELLTGTESPVAL